mmetsp:Transcript_5772/g.17901  ORF Transcript_5772/g.17901 Transcript_5772/m.17901 type:complete len:225 (+) Transcript_5772:98-772(+)
MLRAGAALLAALHAIGSCSGDWAPEGAGDDAGDAMDYMKDTPTKEKQLEELNNKIREIEDEFAKRGERPDPKFMTQLVKLRSLLKNKKSDTHYMEAPSNWRLSMELEDFEAMDTSRDGEVSKAEFAAFAPTADKMAFQDGEVPDDPTLDANEDGTVTEEEFMRGPWKSQDLAGARVEWVKKHFKRVMKSADMDYDGRVSFEDLVNVGFALQPGAAEAGAAKGEL